jgi:hypothetical protein
VGVTDFLTQEERALMAQDIWDMVTDPQIGATVLYSSYINTGAFNPATGQVSTNYAGTWIYAMRMRLTDGEYDPNLRTQALPDSRYQLGQFSYLIPVAEIGIVKKDDKITDEGIEQYVTDYETDAVGIFHSVIVRNLGNR